MRIMSIALLSLLWALPVSSFAASTPVATVNGKPLTDFDVQSEVQLLMPSQVSFHGGLPEERMAELRKKALETLVDKELQYQDALARGIKDGGVVDEDYDKIRKKYSTEGDFKKVLAAAGIDDKALRRVIERNVFSGLVRKTMVDDKVAVTDAMVKDHYEKNKSSYDKPKEYKVSHIFKRIDPSLSVEDKAKLKAKMEEILKRIKAGEDFADLASSESDDPSRIMGGNIGYFHSGRVAPEFEDAVKKLKVGEVSGIVQTLYGFHIIKLTDIREPRQLPFEEVKEKIKAHLIEQQRKKYLDEWMDGLRSKAKIEYPKKG